MDGRCHNGTTSVPAYTSVTANIPPSSPVRCRSGPKHKLTLLPYGATDLRIAEFPVVATAKTDDATVKTANVLRTRASFFIEPEAMLSRQSPLHDVLWDGVNRVRAPATMYSPWAPFPHYAVG